MESKLSQKLKFELEPIAICFTDEKPENAFQPEKGKHFCVATAMISAAKNGTVSVFDEDTYGCSGGGVGLCFGNAFERDGHPIDALLSRGDEVLEQRGETYSRSLGVGERFFDSPELVRKWEETFPFTDAPEKYVVFKPLHAVGPDEKPQLVTFFANPDQLSVLVVSAGYYRGKALNVVAPFSSACQQIVMGYQEIGKDQPNAIMGFFDIFARRFIPKEMLSLTVPYSMFLEMDASADDNCLATPAWEAIAHRWDEES